jgi:hypothetical protein
MYAADTLSQYHTLVAWSGGREAYSAGLRVMHTHRAIQHTDNHTQTRYQY